MIIGFLNHENMGTETILGIPAQKKEYIWFCKKK